MWLFILLLPVTLGLGSLWLWAWRRSFVRRVDEDGVQLWSGRRVPWSDVVSLHTLKSYGDADRKMLRLEVQFRVGHGIIRPRWLTNGPEVAEAVKMGMRETLPPEGRMRVHYTQRR
jgi:hypothetical protein